MPETGPTSGAGARRGRRLRVVVVLLVVLVAAAALAVVLTRGPSDRYATTQPATAPATAPSTRAATAPATRSARAKAAPKPKGPATRYFDVVQANYPRMPDTQPMAVPLNLSQAARLVFNEPVYLSPRGDLWITRPDAPPTDAVLARAAKEQSDQLMLTVRETVVFAHWMPRDTGPWTFNLIARRPGPGAGYELVTQDGRHPIGTPGRNYRWERALDWNDKVIVASDTGVSVFQWEPRVTELYVELAPAAKPEGADAAATPAAAPSPPAPAAAVEPMERSEPQFLLDWQGLLAWLPWERGKAGGRGAARFVDGKWTPLGPEQGWPEKLLHVVPLHDGNVLQLVAGEGDAVTVGMAALEQVRIDEAKVAKLVEELSADEQQVRDNAYQELTRFGPSLGPVIERLMQDQDPEAQARLKQLLKTLLEPTLGGMSVLGDQLRLVSRLSDGGAVFYAEAGVMTPGPGDSDTPVFHTPAWLAIRPGQAATLLEPPMTTDMNPDRSKLYAFRSDWVVTNDARGPQRFVGNGFDPLLRKGEAAEGFTEPVGVDPRGRWLFRKPRQPEVAPAGPASPAASPATAATAPTEGDAGPTLVLDATLPDPTPRLPVWLYATAETVGWDKDNWPVVKKGGGWILGESGWRPLKSKEKLFSKPEEVPPVETAFQVPIPVNAAPRTTTAAAVTAPTAVVAATTAPATTAPPTTAGATTVAVATTAPASGPSTQDAGATLAAAAASLAEDLGPLLAVDPDGGRYYDGRSTLRVRARDGTRTDWALPPAATGEGLGGKVYLVRSREGLLFLFNQPGRVVRIEPTPDGDEPFKVDATFTRDVPNTDSVTRVWLDPAGRIIMAYGSKLAIMFPRGYIPRAISDLMSPLQPEQDE